MTKSMLIDAQHEDETRVVIIDGDRIDDFDFVTAAKTQLKGNIYLAKITRVEPSLQAAFVEYGGGKQGFLPFSEIHPDYYQIPIEDKKRLIEEEEEESLREEEEEEEELENRDRRPRRGRSRRRGRGRDRRPREEGQDNAEGWQDADGESAHSQEGGEHAAPLDEDDVFDDGDSDNTEYKASDAKQYAVASEPVVQDEPEAAPQQDAAASETDEPTAESADESGEEGTTGESGEHRERNGRNRDEDGDEDEEDRAETVSDDDMEETRRRRKGSSFKRYRIQEVIKRNQIVLVQVIKEERGNKGVSLTTYISLAGRYCVLMPNSPKAGGVSRKIANGEQRKKLKEVVASLKESHGLAAIIRTAGIDRTKTEIKRDYEYLAKLWSQIRSDTLASTAPALIYEESNVIKRSIRDLYSSDVEQIQVQGEHAYKEAKSFMRMIMPSHAARIKLYKESQPIFSAFGVEEQLATMYEPSARLPSGGSIVLQQTEALISIDVNSGRSTTERNVEETAIKTNLEAAKEVARQLRLRDLAGLIVIDFIDMNYGKNRRNLERAMKEALKVDRAKIQMSRISPFGLMELSRQRLRPSIAESSSQTCPHCEGTGSIRSVETVAIQIIRLLEREASGGEYRTLKVYTYPEVALHLLNERRNLVQRLEQEYNVNILILIDSNILVSKYRLIKIGEDGKEQVHRDELQDSRRRNRRGRRGGRNRDRGDRPDRDRSDRDDSDDDSSEERHSRRHQHRDRFESDDEDDDDADDNTAEMDGDDPDDQPYARSNRHRRPPVEDSDDTDTDNADSDDEQDESSDRSHNRDRNRDRGDRPERGDRDRGRRGRRGGRNRNRDRNRDRGDRPERDRSDGDRPREPREPRQPVEASDDDRGDRHRPQRPERAAAERAAPAEVKPEPAPKPAPVIRDYTPPPAVILEDPSENAEPKQKRRGWWSKSDA